MFLKVFGSELVSDKWQGTFAGAAKAGLRMYGSVNHTDHWRDPHTGVHSNDAESEFARVKLFLRTKYGYCRSSNNKDPKKKDAMLELHISELVFYTNVGRDLEHVMKAMKHAVS